MDNVCLCRVCFVNGAVKNDLPAALANNLISDNTKIAKSFEPFNFHDCALANSFHIGHLIFTFPIHNSNS